MEMMVESDTLETFCVSGRGSNCIVAKARECGSHANQTERNESIEKPERLGWTMVL
jgi:hypothetical protein